MTIVMARKECPLELCPTPALCRGRCAERDSGVLQDDLRDMLQALGLPDCARPQSPHEVFRLCIAEVQRLREQVLILEANQLRLRASLQALADDKAVPAFIQTLARWRIRRMSMSEWQPIETAPESEPILVFAPKAHRGHDSCEVVVLYHVDGEIHWWTNGGANAGSDLYFEPDETPTHWMPLPDPPR